VLRQVDPVSIVVSRVVALVHEDARGDPDERIRHERFLLTRMTAGFVALVSLPPYLVWRGSPEPLECLAILCLVAPIAAATLLSWTGRLTAAQALAAAALAGLVLCAAAASLGLASPAILWLAIPAAMGHAGALGLLHTRSEDETRAARRSRLARDLSLSSVIEDLVTWHDRSGHVLDASGAAAKLFGVPPSALRGRGLFSRVHVSDRPAFLKAVSDAATNDEPVVVKVRIHVADQAAPAEAQMSRGELQPGGEARVIWGEMRIKRIDASRDGEPCVVALTRDISASAQHGEELATARAEAAHVGAAKGQFLAMVSHELRTPLNAIIGFSEILASDALAVEPGRRNEYLHIIRNSGEHLLQVVNTLLDMSRIEAGKFDVLPEPFDIAHFTHGCCDLMGLKAEQAGILLARDIAVELPELVADRRACKQMLINLLSNAIKFTPPGGRVSVAARRECDRILFVIADTGIGICESDLPRLGDPFFQAHLAYDRRHEGTGLGLSVVRGLVGLHRGSLTIESAPDEGTSVTVSLPIDCRTGTSSKGGPVRIHTLPRRPSPARALKVG
jgi:cell cycle sensor histidine kinase DivJ